MLLTYVADFNMIVQTQERTWDQIRGQERDSIMRTAIVALLLLAALVLHSFVLLLLLVLVPKLRLRLRPLAFAAPSIPALSYPCCTPMMPDLMAVASAGARRMSPGSRRVAAGCSAGGTSRCSR